MTNWTNYGKWRHGKKRKELLENKVMNKEEVIGKTFNLDLGSTPVEVKVIEITDSKVIVEYLRSTPGRVQEFSISDFEYFAMIKIETIGLLGENVRKNGPIKPKWYQKLIGAFKNKK